MDLISLAKGLITNQVLDTIVSNTGIKQDQAKDATSSILELLISGLAKNTVTPEGAASLDKALTDDHDGSILSSIGDILTGKKPEGITDNTLNGGKIISHILGNQTDTVTELVSRKTGVPKNTVSNLLVELAPIVLGVLGKTKKETRSDADGMASLLSQSLQKEESEGNIFIGMVKIFLDKDNDGNYMDDLLDIAMKQFGSK